MAATHATLQPRTAHRESHRPQHASAVCGRTGRRWARCARGGPGSLHVRRRARLAAQGVCAAPHLDCLPRRAPPSVAAGAVNSVNCMGAAIESLFADSDKGNAGKPREGLLSRVRGNPLDSECPLRNRGAAGSRSDIPEAYGESSASVAVRVRCDVLWSALRSHTCSQICARDNIGVHMLESARMHCRMQAQAHARRRARAGARARARPRVGCTRTRTHMPPAPPPMPWPICFRARACARAGRRRRRGRRGGLFRVPALDGVPPGAAGRAGGRWLLRQRDRYCRPPRQRACPAVCAGAGPQRKVRAAGA